MVNDMRLDLAPAKRISDAFFATVLGLITLSMAGQCSKYVWGHPKLKGFVPAFYVDYESTVPTWYSSLALGVAAGLMFLIAAAMFRTRDRWRIHWATLASLMLVLSIDEIAMFHELPIDPLRESFGAGGLLYYTWVVPGLALVVIVSGLYLSFFFHLPRRTKALFALAAATFVTGAIGVEMLSGWQADQFGEENLTYSLIITVEEFLEMIGVVILIRALLEHVQDQLGGLQISFATGVGKGTEVPLQNGAS